MELLRFLPRAVESCSRREQEVGGLSLAGLIAAGTSTKRMRNIYHDSQELISDIVRDYRVQRVCNYRA